MSVSGVVPARFLTLTAHMVLTVTVLWSRDDNVRASLPVNYSTDQYDAKDTELVMATSLSLTCFVLEYFGFFGGISTFMGFASLLSTVAHSTACVCIAFYVWDMWDSTLYWYIFAFTCLLPALIEIGAFVRVLVFKRP